MYDTEEENNIKTNKKRNIYRENGPERKKKKTYEISRMKKRTDWYKNIKIKRDKSTSFLIEKRFQRTHASLSSSHPHDTATRLLDYCMSFCFLFFFLIFDFVIRENDRSSRFFHQEHRSEGIKTARLGIFVVRPHISVDADGSKPATHDKMQSSFYFVFIRQSF